MPLIGGSGGFCCDDHVTVIDCSACPIISVNMILASKNYPQIKLQLLPQLHCLNTEYFAHLNLQLSADFLKDLVEVMEACLEVLVLVVDGSGSDEDIVFNN